MRKSPAQVYALVFGLALLLAGIVGFFYTADFSTGDATTDPANRDALIGVFDVNGWHNVVHILIGLLLLACAGTAARSAALGVGLLYLVLSIWGFIESDNVLLGLLPVNDEDNVLHLVLGLLGLGAGAASPAIGRPKPA